MPQCSNCKNELPLESFERTGNGDHRRGTCRDCRKTGRTASVAKAIRHDAEAVQPKSCRVCGKPPSDATVFAIRKDKVSLRYRTICNFCDNQRRNNARAKRQKVAKAV